MLSVFAVGLLVKCLCAKCVYCRSLGQVSKLSVFTVGLSVKCLCAKCVYCRSLGQVSMC